MAEPLKIEFQADTSRAQSAMQNLAASVLANMASVSVAMSGGASNLNVFGGSIGELQKNVGRVASAVASDIKGISVATASAAAAEKASLQSVVTAFTAAAASSNTAQASVKAGIAGTGTALTTLLGQVPALGLIGGAIGGIVASYALVTAAVGQANEQLDRFIGLGASAEKAGVSVEFYQRFKDAAEEAKLGANEIEQALRQLTQAVRPTINGDGPVRQSINQIFESGYLGGYQSQGVAAFNRAKTDEERSRAAIQAMRELLELGNQVAAFEFGEKIFPAATLDRIRSGRLDLGELLDRLDQKREDIITTQQVQQAEEFRDKLNAAYKEIDAALGVSISLAEAGQGINNIWLKIVDSTAKAAANAKSFLQNMAAAPGANIQSPLAFRTPGEGEGSLAADLGAVGGRQERGRRLYDTPIGPRRPDGYIDPEDAPTPPRRPPDLLAKDPPASTGRGRSSASETDQVQTFINQLQKSAAALKAEAEAFNLSNVEKRVAIELARANEVATAAGTKVTDTQAASIRKLAEEAANAKDKIADLEQKQRQGAEAARYFGAAAADALGDLIIEGRSATEVMNNLARSFSRSLLQGIFTGQGPLAGLLQTAAPASAGPGAVGGLAGIISSFASYNPIPALAGGGAVTGPGSGTSDSVLARLSNGEFVVNAQAAATHRDLLELLNRGLPGFAAGGLVAPNLPQFGTIAERGREGSYAEIWA